MKRHNDQKIGDALKDMVSAYKLKPKLHQTKIRTVWAELMGPTINGYTRSLSLRKNTLYINLDSAPLKQELSYGKEKIVDLLNEALGEAYIKTVVIR